MSLASTAREEKRGERGESCFFDVTSIVRRSCLIPLPLIERLHRHIIIIVDCHQKAAAAPPRRMKTKEKANLKFHVRLDYRFLKLLQSSQRNVWWLHNQMTFNFVLMIPARSNAPILFFRQQMYIIAVFSLLFSFSFNFTFFLAFAAALARSPASARLSFHSFFAMYSFAKKVEVGHTAKKKRNEQIYALRSEIREDQQRLAVVMWCNRKFQFPCLCRVYAR